MADQSEIIVRRQQDHLTPVSDDTGARPALQHSALQHRAAKLLRAPFEILIAILSAADLGASSFVADHGLPAHTRTACHTLGLEQPLPTIANDATFTLPAQRCTLAAQHYVPAQPGTFAA